MLLLLVRADELHVAHKRGRQLIEAHDRRVAVALLKPAYVLLAEARELRQLLLRGGRQGWRSGLRNGSRRPFDFTGCDSGLQDANLAGVLYKSA
jgi:hypothetical protein